MSVEDSPSAGPAAMAVQVVQAAVSAPARAAVVRCAPGAEAREDQRYGTAVPAPRWLLIEEPGPWGRNALLQSGLDAVVATRLDERARAAGVRVMLIRRPGRRSAPASRRWAVVDSRPGREASRWGGYATDAELLEVPLDVPPGAPAGGTDDVPPGAPAGGTAGEWSRAPTYLVCAHGRHDACCAIRGRPVAAALAAVRPEATWECSHTGGDRFAANLIVLPHGFYYGHISPVVAPGVVEAYESGRVDPTWLRGRSSLAAPVQAAQHHARLVLGEDGVDALAPLEVEQLDGARWRVRLTHPCGPVEVVVAARRSEPVPRLTCAATRPESVRVFDLVDLSQ